MFIISSNCILKNISRRFIKMSQVEHHHLQQYPPLIPKLSKITDEYEITNQVLGNSQSNLDKNVILKSE
jgi:hypothetical protein